MNYQTKDFRLDLKSVGDNGTFEGYLSVFDVIDLSGDSVAKGAFTNTIQEQKGIVPMLWGHDTKQPIGILDVSEDDTGLPVKGEFFIAESAKAAELYGLSKKFYERGRPMGLSIGYDTIKKEMVKGVRVLKELKLYEGSLTLFPMLPVAQMTSIKSADAEKSNFLAELDMAQTMVMRDMMQSALDNALDGIVWDTDVDPTYRMQAVSDCIDQFKSAYLAFLPRLFDAWVEKSGVDTKVGRRHSAADRAMLEEMLQRIQALLSEEAAGTWGAPQAAGTSAPEAAAKTNEPEAIHSWLRDYTEKLKSQLNAA